MTTPIRTTRRTFIKHAAVAGAALPIAMPHLVRAQSANGKVRLAGIGVGGKGAGDISSTAKEHAIVVALCDVDLDRASESIKKFPDAKLFRDYREMLDKLGKDLDGVTVSTPDHMHAPVTMTALQLGLATYTQKPMTRTVYEARQLAAAAKKAGVVTQMGNQGHSGVGYRMVVDLVRDGVIGKIKEAHAWSDRPIWPQGRKRPEGSDPVPANLDWNLWLGVAKDRPYVDKWPEAQAAADENDGGKKRRRGGDRNSKVYCPFVWRGWYDFGAGALGDMGCHIIDPIYWSMELTAPKSIAYDGPTPMPEMFPEEETLTYVFPGTKWTASDEIVVKWYDGGRKPPVAIAGMGKDQDGNPRDLPTNGSLYIGEKGTIMCPHGGGPQVFINNEMADVKRREYEPMDHYMTWTNAIRGEGKTTSHFGYAGPLTETVLLGVVASRVPDKTLQWDAAKLRFTNSEEGNRFIKEDYRKGWEVTGLA